MTAADNLGAASDAVTVAGVVYGVYRYRWIRKSHDLPAVDELTRAVGELSDLSPREAARDRHRAVALAAELESTAADRTLRAHAATTGATLAQLADLDAVSARYGTWTTELRAAAAALKRRGQVIRRQS